MYQKDGDPSTRWKIEVRMAKRIRNRVLWYLTEKEKKERRRISQSEIARAINVSPTTIGSWIREDVTKIEEHVLLGLCDYFGVRFDELLYVEETPDEPPAT
jgi:DNA-binding XRE family transcriptional regulator